MRQKGSRSHRELQVEYTPKAVSGWGGLAPFGRFVRRLRVRELLAIALPDGRVSKNVREVVDMAVQLMASVLIGGTRFEHVERVRCDEVIMRIFEVTKFASASSITRYFGNFVRSHSEHLHWTLNALVYRTIENTSDVLDLDSTTFLRWGDQEGSQKGYCPRRPGMRTHQPLLAMLSRTKLIVHAWLRAGAASTHRGACEFLLELLAALPSSFRLEAVRADSGFFNHEFLSLLELHKVPYVIPVKMSRGFKTWCAKRDGWQRLSAKVAVAEDLYISPKNRVPRRVIIIRTLVHRISEGTLFPVIDYEYSALVTTLKADPRAVIAFYHGRGDCENRIKELKYDFNADSYCLHSFDGTEAVLRLICFTYNLFSLYKQNVLRNMSPTLTTIRDHGFVIGSYLGSSGRTQKLRLGLASRFRARMNELLTLATTTLDSIAAQLDKLFCLLADRPSTRWQLRYANVFPLVTN